MTLSEDSEGQDLSKYHTSELHELSMVLDLTMREHSDCEFWKVFWKTIFLLREPMCTLGFKITIAI